MKPVFFLLAFLAALCARAQDVVKDSTLMYRVETTDGNRYDGYLLKRDTAGIRLRTLNIGDITISQQNIVRVYQLKGNIRPFRRRVRGEWVPHVQSTRYFITSNGYGLRKGEGYYQNVWVLYNQGNYGITDRFSIGLGTIPMFLFALDETPIWFTPKLTVPLNKDRVNLGIGAFVGTITNGDVGSFGMLTVAPTFGNLDKNATIGLGYGFANGSIARLPLITLSALYRTGPKGYILTENFFLGIDNEGVGIASIGGRRMYGRASIEYGLFVPFYTDAASFELVAVPWLGVMLPFGKVRGGE